MRITNDGHAVKYSDFVYEILYTYLNAEASIAEPAISKAEDIPIKFPIWKIEANCQKECDKLNNQIKTNNHESQQCQTQDHFISKASAGNEKPSTRKNEPTNRGRKKVHH